MPAAARPRDDGSSPRRMRGRHPADDRAAGDGQQRIAGVHRLGEAEIGGLGKVDGHALTLERGEKAVVLLPDDVEIGRSLALPVPAFVRIDERAHAGVPCIGANALELRPGATHEHRPQFADFAVRPPARSPDALELLNFFERGLGKRREEALVIGLGKDVLALHRPILCSATRFRMLTRPWTGRSEFAGILAAVGSARRPRHRAVGTSLPERACACRFGNSH